MRGTSGSQPQLDRQRIRGEGAAGRWCARPWLAAAALFVAACGGGDGGTESPTSPVTPPPAPLPEPTPENPPAPTGLRYSAAYVGGGAWQAIVTFSWDPVPDVDGYAIQISHDGTFPEEVDPVYDLRPWSSSAPTTRGPYRFRPDEPQYFRVAAYFRPDPNSLILSDWAGPVLAIPKLDPATPPAPTGLRVSVVTETTVTWSWDAVAGADGYRFDVRWGDRGAGSVVTAAARAFGDPPSWEDDLPAPNLSGEATVAAYFGPDPESATWTAPAPPVRSDSLYSEPFPTVDVEELVIRERTSSDRPDDFSGDQVHFVYAVASDGVDYELDTSGVLARLVGNVQVFLRRKLGRQLRIDTYGGRPDITFVRFADWNEEELRSGNGFVSWRFRDGLAAELGFRSRKVYALVYTHGAVLQGLRITGEAAEGIAAAYWSPVERENYVRGTLRLRQEATVIHEIFHLMGAVPRCAPNSDGGGHVYGARAGASRYDIMQQGGTPSSNPARTEIDAGRDDYYGHGRSDCTDIARSTLWEPPR